MIANIQLPQLQKQYTVENDVFFTMKQRNVFGGRASLGPTGSSQRSSDSLSPWVVLSAEDPGQKGWEGRGGAFDMLEHSSAETDASPIALLMLFAKRS